MALHQPPSITNATAISCRKSHERGPRLRKFCVRKSGRAEWARFAFGANPLAPSANTAMGSDSLGAAAGLRGICWGCALRLRKSAKGTKCARARHLFVPLVIGRAHARFWARNEERRRRRPEPRRIPAMLGIIAILEQLSRGGPTAAHRATCVELAAVRARRIGRFRPAARSFISVQFGRPESGPGDARPYCGPLGDETNTKNGGERKRRENCRRCAPIETILPASTAGA